MPDFDSLAKLDRSVDRPKPVRAGTQSVERALRLLLQIAADGSKGLALSDLAARVKLDRSTTHRLLASLARFGLVEQDRRGRQYYLGLEFFTVAAAASNRHELSDPVRESLLRVQAQTGCAAWFFLCSGTDLVCVDLVLDEGYAGTTGDYLGMRRPIGSDSASVAVLASLPDLEWENIVLKNIRKLSQDPEVVVVATREALLRARTEGFSRGDAAPDGTFTLAMAVLDPDGKPRGALTLGHSDIGKKGCPVSVLAEILRQEVWQLEEALQLEFDTKSRYSGLIVKSHT